MKQKYLIHSLALPLLLLLLIMGTVVLAQTSAGFNLEWHVIGSGGQASSSSSYRVNGTIGQGIASPPSASSPNFILNSGYWLADTQTTIYLPAIIKN